jgi:acyl carrier protein
MNRSEILAKINEIFQDAFDDESLEVNEATTANDIEGWDSLMQMNLIEMIEDEFEFQFSMDEVAALKNVGSIVDVVAARV